MVRNRWPAGAGCGLTAIAHAGTPRFRTARLQSGIRTANFFAAGFTLLELVVVICVAGVIAVIAANRFLYLEERAEKAALEGVLAGVKMGLQIRMA